MSFSRSPSRFCCAADRAWAPSSHRPWRGRAPSASARCSSPADRARCRTCPSVVRPRASAARLIALGLLLRIALGAVELLLQALVVLRLLIARAVEHVLQSFALALLL